MMADRGGKLAATIAALLFAGLALFTGIDRYSAHMPSAVRLVPDDFRVDAARSRAAASLAAGDYAAARAAAERAIRRDPLDPRGPAFLAAALQMSGEDVRAGIAFRQAATLGWHEPLTQAYWFTRAIGQGNPAAAALRLDALLRAHPDFAPAQDYLRILETSSAGRRAVLERVSGDTRWASIYLSAFEGSDAILRERARFIASEAENGLAFGCERTLPMVRELARRQYRVEANLLLAAQCPEQRESGALADAGFERFGEDALSGLGWRRHGSGDVRITPVGGEDRGIEMANRSGVTRLVLSQPVALAPGRHVVRGNLTGGDDSLLVSLDCGKPARPKTLSQDISAGVMLAAPDCANQILGLWLRPGGSAVMLGGLTVAPR